jgi:site-specific DNA-methyltransferase (adenine-specific)/adenine-specific DNA-methyltransferase
VTDHQPTQAELFDVAELPGRPMLHWHGKRPLREIPYYPAQLRERYGEFPAGAEPAEAWANRLYWGDNLQVMAHLMREFRGQIKLIYIDPPFDSGADYRKRVKLRGTSVQTDLGVLEERQYTDIWSNDLYLQYMYERLILMRELLADEGSICLHCDWHRVHHLRCMMDEVFGADNFINLIVWHYENKPQFGFMRHYPRDFDFVLLYAKQFGQHTLHHQMVPVKKVQKQAVVDWDPVLKKRVAKRDEDGDIIYEKRTEKYMGSVWTIPLVHPMAHERTGFPTQKPEDLLERLVTGFSDPGDLVADFFIGSGTTAAVAQKLGRRWIGADINLGAIHTTAQRLARIIEEQQSTSRQPELLPTDQSTNLPIYQTFEVYNVNHYEVFKNAEEARDIVLQLYGVEPLKGHRFFDGTLDGRWVKVIDLNRICSKLDIQTIFDNLPPDDTRGVVVLCAGHEYDGPQAIKQRNLMNIPFDVRDILTDRKDVIFKRPPEARVRLSRADGQVTLTVEQFYSPLLLQKLSLEDDAEAIEDWRQTVASVLIDPAYDGQVFHARITDTPARREELVQGEYTWAEEERGEGQVAVKIVDVLDEEWFGVVEGAT